MKTGGSKLVVNDSISLIYILSESSRNFIFKVYSTVFVPELLKKNAPSNSCARMAADLRPVQ